MIHQIEHRRSFWKDHHVERCQGDSVPRPYEAVPGYTDFFEGRRVLEIGPGEGRQYSHLRDLASAYHVADIVGEVLELPQFERADGRHLIDRYDTRDLGERFDTITFWYVLHHVRLDEAGGFFGFLARHLAPGGALLFNAPHANPEHEMAAGEGDGCATTPWTPDLVHERLGAIGLGAELTVDLAPNCLVFLARPAGAGQAAPARVGDALT